MPVCVEEEFRIVLVIHAIIIVAEACPVPCRDGRGRSDLHEWRDPVRPAGQPERLWPAAPTRRIATARYMASAIAPLTPPAVAVRSLAR